MTSPSWARAGRSAACITPSASAATASSSAPASATSWPNSSQQARRRHPSILSTSSDSPARPQPRRLRPMPENPKRKSMSTNTDITAGEEARALHRDALVFAGLALAYVLDAKFTQRCLEGGMPAANVTFALEENWDRTLGNFEKHLAKIDKSPLLTLCSTADEVVAARKKGRLGIVIGTQGASMIQEESEFWRLDLMVRMGLRFLGLAYTTSNAFGDGCCEKRDAGLTYLGEEFIERETTLPIK